VQIRHCSSFLVSQGLIDADPRFRLLGREFEREVASCLGIVGAVSHLYLEGWWDDMSPCFGEVGGKVRKGLLWDSRRGKSPAPRGPVVLQRSMHCRPICIASDIISCSWSLIIGLVKRAGT